MSHNERIVVQEWNNAARRWVIAHDAPLASAVVQNEPSLAPAHGYCATQDDVRSAVYVWEHRLIFHFEDVAYDWQRDAVDVHHRRQGLHKSSVTVEAAGRRIMKMAYKSELGKAIDVGDMTFDAIDEETTDWWLWLSLLSRDETTQENVRSLLDKGV